MPKESFRPSTVNELIESLEFIRDVLGGGNLDITLVGTINENSKVYGANAELCSENPHATILMSDEHAKIYPEYIGILYNGEFIKAD